MKQAWNDGICRWLLLLVLVLGAASVGAAPPAMPGAPVAGVPPAAEMKEITSVSVDRSLLNPRAKAVLDSPEFRWRHGRTEHMILHFENGIFATKVARMAEFFHRYIAADLPGAKDRLEGPSHIFIFRDAKDWKTFQRDHGEPGLEWAFSMVQGPVMYLQQAGSLSGSAEVLGHEMTHLVVNRLVEGQLPLWLNEGLAEWYGEFAYAAFKGIKKSRRTQFTRLPVKMSLAELMAAESYPADHKDVGAFYAVAKQLVGFLLLRYPPEKLALLLQALAEGGSTEAALTSIYGFADLGDFEKQFEKFSR